MLKKLFYGSAPPFIHKIGCRIRSCQGKYSQISDHTNRTALIIASYSMAGACSCNIDIA